MVSAIPLCVLALVATVVSSQFISNDSDELESDQPLAERRTFKHKKHIKFLPLIKKHKKFGLWTPHVFGKIRYADVPVYHEAPVKYEVKPAPEFHAVSAPETIIETHHEYAPSFPSIEHTAPPSSSFFFLHDKPLVSGAPLPPPVFSSPAIPTFFLQPQPVLSIVSLPPQTIPIRVPAPAPVLPTISIVKPAPEPILSPVTVKIPAPALPAISSPTPAPVVDIPAPSPAPVLHPVHVSTPSPAPIVSVSSPSPAPVLPPVSIPAPAPVLPSVSIPAPAPVLPSVSIPAPAPLPIFTPVKLPAPALPSIPAPSPAPVFPAVSIAPAPILPSFPSVSLPTPAPALPISVTPEPEYPYPPSGTPIPSYIKDTSLPVTEPTPAAVTPNYDEVHGHDDEKVSLSVARPDHSLFQKFMEWKEDKANAALNHFSSFKQKPVVFPQQPITVTTVAPPHHIPSFPSLQIPVPFRPLPLTPDFRPPQVFFPQSAPILPPVNYESFPPNHIQPSSLFNSYGAPIPHDTYGPPAHDSHDRLSPEASEEEPSILPPPSAFQNQDKIQSPESQPQQEIPRVKNLIPKTNESNEHVPEQNNPLNQVVDSLPAKETEGVENPQPEAEDTNPQTE